MASTYVNDLRLNELGTGDGSGTWGTTTNTNFELIAESLSFGTEAITTNADTHTSTIADGAADPARSIYIKYTGTLDSACTITIAPNTVSRLHFIENGTSGSQNIIISQGSGANVTIPPGDVKVVYLDGAGSGAAVVDAFASLSVVDLTASGVITGSTLEATGDTSAGDNAAIGYTSAEGLILTGQGSTNDVTIKNDADADVLEIPTGTTNVTIAGNLGVGGTVTGTGTSVFASLDISGDIDVDGTANLDVVDIDGAVDMASTLQVDGAITSSAGATITTADNTAQLILKSTDADASTGPLLQLHRDSSSPADDDAMGTIDFRGENSASETINYVRINTRSADVTDGTEDAKFDVNTLVAGASVNRFSMTPTETVFNEDSVDVDFRVEGNGDANLLYVDAGNDRIGIGTTTIPTADSMVTVRKDGAANEFNILSGTSHGSVINMGDADDYNIQRIKADNSSNSLQFQTNNAERMRLDSSGNLGIGTSSPSALLSVDSGTTVLSGTVTNQTSSSYATNDGGIDNILSLNSTGSSATQSCGIQFSLTKSGQTGAISEIGAIRESSGNSGLVFRTRDSSTGRNERMRISSAGNVGIGEASPDTQLHISSGAPNFRMEDTDTNRYANFSYGTRVLNIDNVMASGEVGTTVDPATAFRFTDTNGTTEVARFVPDNKSLCIGRTTSIFSSKFNVDSDNDTENPMAVISQHAGSSSEYLILFYRGNDSDGYTLTGHIQNTNNATSYNTSSDYRLKTNVSYNWDATSRLKQLKPARFDWISDGDDAVTVDGFLAHEVSSVVPEAITGTKDATKTETYIVTPAVIDSDGNETTPAVKGTRTVPDYQAIDQSKIVPLLVKTIQELEARIAALEAN